MNVYCSEKQKVKSIYSVSIKTKSTPIDMSKTSVSLHIGKQDEHNDFLISFPESKVLIKGESKFSESGSTIIFNGKSKSSFAYEQNQAKISSCKLKFNYFLFVTNVHMDETDKENVVDVCSMFINKERWIDAFSPIFEFLKDLSKFD
jgi:hypothetical protein